MARRLENLHGRALDSDPEKDVERDGMRGWADNDNIDEKEKSEAGRFKREEKIRKEAQAFTQEMNLLNQMSREELESERASVLKFEKIGVYRSYEAHEKISQIDKRIIKFLEGMSREELEDERNRWFGLEQNYELMYEIDKRIKQAERLEQDKLKESAKDRSVDYTGPLAGFMVHSEEGQEKTVDVNRYTSRQESNPYIALSFASPEGRQQLEAKLSAEFEKNKAKETEIGRIDKATHDLRELAQGHDIEIDKGDKDF